MSMLLRVINSLSQSIQYGYRTAIDILIIMIISTTVRRPLQVAHFCSCKSDLVCFFSKPGKLSSCCRHMHFTSLFNAQSIIAVLRVTIVWYLISSIPMLNDSCLLNYTGSCRSLRGSWLRIPNHDDSASKLE